MAALLAHMQILGRGREDEQAAAEYCRYLPVKVRGITESALVDSGNLWRCCISPEFLYRLGLGRHDLQPIAVKTLTTAKTGGNMKVLGELRQPLHFALGGLATKYKIRPVVIEGLSMAMNLSGPFMKAHGINQEHTTDSLRVQGKRIPLLRQPQDRTAATLGQSGVYVVENATVPARSHMILKLRAPAGENKSLTAGDCLLQGDTEFMTKTDLHPWLNALVTIDQHGNTYGGVMNSTMEPIQLKAGMRFGSIAAVRPDAAEADLCVMETGSEAAAVGQGQLAAGHKLSAIKEERESHKSVKFKSRKEKEEWVIENFKLKESSVLRTKEEFNRAVQLLVSYFDVFSVDGEFGQTNIITHRIYTEDVPPIREKVRPLNPALEEDLKKQIDKWRKHDVIKPTSSPWNFALVAAPKKGGKIRWCVDYRRLNEITYKDSFPIPNIGDNLNRLADSRIFSGIDGSGAYHVVPIHEADQPKTAFATPFGSFCFKSMPFGLTNAPATYCRLVQQVLHGIPLSVAVPYLDDTCVHSKDLESHFQGLARVLDAFRKAGLKLQPSKCQLLREDIEYLGHIISRDGIRPVPAYLEIVKTWPLPSTKSEARTFLGKCGYYRRFIKDYSKIAKPWTDVMGKTDKAAEKEPLQVTPAMTDSFQQLKKALLTAPILAYPRFDSPEPFILDTDWSQDAATVGAVLSQRQGGQERVICYGAKKLPAAGKNYASQKGELAAVIYFMRDWKYYLLHRPFILRTDHSSLQWIRTMEAPAPMLRRWLDTLASYQFTVEHRKGTLHGNADALSRVQHAKEMDDADFFLGNISAILPNCPDWSVEYMRERQISDEDLRLVRKWISKQINPDKLEKSALSSDGRLYADMLTELYLDRNELLRRHQTAGVQGKGECGRVCLPRELWEEAMAYAHASAAHQGRDVTLQRLQPTFYFPAMKKEVDAFVKACLPCAAKQKGPHAQKHTLMSTCTGYPFQRISIDFVGPLNETKTGKKYILTVLDTFTKWLEAFPVKRAVAKEVVAILEREIFARYGLPEKIHSDRGSQFTGNLMNEVGQVLGYQITHTPAYHAQSNPVERSHRSIGECVRSMLEEDAATSWEQALPAVLFALRTAVHRSTKLTPFRLLFGRDAQLPLDMLFGDPPTIERGDRSYHQYAQELKQRHAAAAKWAREHIGQAVLRNRRHYHQEQKLFVEGQRVWLFTPIVDKSKGAKFTQYWSGPWMLMEQISPVLYRIQPHPSWKTIKKEMVVSVDRMKVFRPPIPLDGVEPNVEPADATNLEQNDDQFLEAWFPDEEDYDIRPETPPPAPVQRDNPPDAAAPPVEEAALEESEEEEEPEPAPPRELPRRGLRVRRQVEPYQAGQ